MPANGVVLSKASIPVVRGCLPSSLPLVLFVKISLSRGFPDCPIHRQSRDGNRFLVIINKRQQLQKGKTGRVTLELI